ncbi:MAG: response regulator [Pirellulaceae bacterium]
MNQQQGENDDYESLALKVLAAFAEGSSLLDSARRLVPELCKALNGRFSCVSSLDSDDPQVTTAQFWHPEDSIDCDDVYERLRKAYPRKTLEKTSHIVSEALEKMVPIFAPLVSDNMEDEDRLLILVIPVISRGKAVMAVEFFGDPDVFREDDIPLLARQIMEQLSLLAKCWNREEAYHRLAQIVDSSYEAIIGKDRRGNIISWNAGAESVYGYTTEEVLGKPVSILFPEGMEQEEEEIREALRTGDRLSQFETQRRQKSGRVIPISLTLSPIVDTSGRIIGSSTIERDVTELKQAEAELEKAKAAAEMANKTRSEFIANVSHEIRTPMNAIIGMTQLALAEDEIPEEIGSYIETANSSAHTLLSLLNDILDFSKIESGKFTIDNEPFNLRQVIDETLRSLSSRAYEKGLEVAIDYDYRIPDELIGDAIRVRQIVTNLVSNAIKFTDKGEILISAQLRRDWPEEARIRFFIRDTGVGIAPEDQPRMFEPFTQVDSSATRLHGGSGLGLTICHELLQLMGSRLEMSSKPGVGSQFSFTLQFPKTPNSRGRQVQAVLPPRFAGIEVLVADDNETNRKILCELLAAWNLKPIAVPTAEDAFRAYQERIDRNQRFDLALIDALMPGIDGYELCRQIIKLSADNPPPLILMAAPNDRQQFRERERDLHLKATLDKPITASSLHDALVEALAISSHFAPPTRRLEKVSAFQALKVLLVEDTPANRKLVTSLLKKRGHQVIEAHNGREAINQFEEGTFDIILMDVQMPIMDGLQTTAAIRQIELDEDLEPTPIVAMTAHAMQGDREKCLRAGMDAYVTKPIDIDNLLHTLESLVEDGTPSPAPAFPAIVPEKEVLDVTATLRRLGGDQDLYTEFIGYFDEDVPPLLRQIPEQLATGDLETLERTAHSLKGLAGSVGGDPASRIAGEMETAARENKPAAVRDLVKPLQEEFNLLNQALQPYRKEE